MRRGLRRLVPPANRRRVRHRRLVRRLRVLSLRGTPECFRSSRTLCCRTRAARTPRRIVPSRRRTFKTRPGSTSVRADSSSSTLRMQSGATTLGDRRHGSACSATNGRRATGSTHSYRICYQLANHLNEYGLSLRGLSASEAKGRKFESCRAHYLFLPLL
jgi:hypothetical protein